MGKPLRILVIAGSEDEIQEVILQTLRSGGYNPEFARMATARALRDVLATRSWDIILYGDHLQGFTAREALSVLQSERKKIPFLVVSGAVGEETVADYMRWGAADFIRKDNLSRLIPAVERELAAAQPETMQENADAVTRSRLQIKNALVDYEEAFQRFMEEAPIGICLADLSGRVKYINQKIEEATGWKLEELAEREGLLLGFFDEETQKHLLERLAARLAGDEARTTEIPITRKDGSKLWVNLKTTILYREGVPSGLLMGFIDVTDRILAEQKILESEEKYRLLVENSREVIVIAQEGKLKFVNRASVEMFDSSYQTLTSTPFIEFIHPEDREMVMSYHLRRTKGEPAPSHYAFRVVTRAGEVRWAEIRSTVVNWEGKPATLNFITDITRRRESELALKASEERYRFLTEKMTDIVWIAGMDLLTTYVTPSIQKVLGFTQEERMRQSLMDQLTPASLTRVLEVLTREMEAEKKGDMDPSRTVNMELEFYHKDGSTRWLDVLISGIRNGQQNLTGIHGVARDVTVRKHAEEKLRESEERFNALFDQSRDCVYVIDLAGNFVDANVSALHLLGYERPDITSLNILSLLDEKDVEKGMREFEEIIRTGFQKYVSGYTLKRKDGRRIYVETQASLVYKDGKPHSILGIARDITERKLMEDAIRQSEERYRTIIEQMADGYFEISLAGRFIFVNDAQCANLGYSREEMLNMSSRQYIAKDKRKEISVLFGKIYDTGVPVRSYDVELIKKDGSRAYHAISASLIRNAEGKPVGFRGISRDVTERKTAEMRLRGYADEISDLYNNAPCGYHSLGPDGSFLRINDTELKWLGYERDELIGRKKWSDLLTRESQVVFQIVFPQLQKEGWINDVEFEVTRKDGSVFTVLQNARAIRDEEGRFVQSRSTIFDITQLKKTQSELRTKNLELTKAYEDLSRKQELILMQEKMASIGMLAAGVAHEIKNPLAIILQGINYLQTTFEKDALTLEVIERLNKAVLQADTIVKGLLSYARQTPVAPVKQDIRNLLEESLVLTEHEFHAKNIQLIRDYQLRMPRVPVDGNQMKQVFVNLIINAVEAMPRRGKLTISARKTVDSEERPVLQISFRDTGHGIPADRIHQIFDPFYTTKSIGNTGLGLSISKGIIDMHGGIIYAESREEEGTNVIIQLPVPS